MHANQPTKPAVVPFIHPRLCLIAFMLGTAASWAADAGSSAPGTLLHDFDHDGTQERILAVGGTNQIQKWSAAKSAWEDAGYRLPDGVKPVDEQGREAGLRFIDLNGDGFDDILFSGPTKYSVHLWTKNVRPELGWTRGWSQFVRAGARTGAKSEPPSLVDADVRLENGFVVVTHRATPTKPASVERLSAAGLIAFDMPPPKSPEEALAAFRVRPGFRVELVAAEPLVVDPVAFDWGADGRFWVVEMGDYPLGLDGKGKPGGVVKVLEDLDGDGRHEKATTFLEGIGFPTSLMPWSKGVLIAAAPDILYAEDTDGDGKADVRKVLFTGFTEGNQQHRINGFEWGLDGWIYAANGDSGGRVKSFATGKVVDIRGRDIRFKPGTGELETVSAQTQFGRRRDDWGNWFGNNNPTWLWHVTVPEHYLRRNPQLAVRSVRKVLANYPESTRVFPASAPMVRPNQPWSINHVTSGCSPTPYRDDLFGTDFATTVFASEPVHNSVHREVLERDGSGFSSRRAKDEEQSEFLSSTDNWFRPVTLKTGPDGALYVADMYRFVLEHPEWISPEMQARVDVRAGADKGRIYRVVPEGKPRRRIPNLAAMTSPRLVEAMNSPSGWQRDTAQRLLFDLAATNEVSSVAKLLGLTHAPQVRVQALGTLGLFKAVTPDTITAALADPHPAVRAEALRQGEVFGGKSDAVLEALKQSAADSDASVRLQAAFSLGAWPAAQIEPTLGELAARGDADETLKVAIMSSLPPGNALFETMRRNAPHPKPAATVALKPSSDDRAKVIAAYAGMESLVGDAANGRRHFQALCASCHRVRGEGIEVGPDLGMVATKPADWLLTAILDPNQSVEARYRSWTVKLKSSDELSGLLSAETANNIVLRLAGGIEHAVLRGDIASMEPMKLSLMPTGIESALKPQDMADLGRWLRAP